MNVFEKRIPAFFLSILFCFFSAAASGGEAIESDDAIIASHLSTSGSVYSTLDSIDPVFRILLTLSVDEERDPNSFKFNSAVFSKVTPASFFPLFRRNLYFRGVNPPTRTPVLGQSSGLAPPAFV